MATTLVAADAPATSESGVRLAEALVAQLPSEIREELPTSETESVAAVADFTWSFADSKEGQQATDLAAGDAQSPTLPLSRREPSEELWKVSRPATPEPLTPLRPRSTPKYVAGKKAAGVVRSIPYTTAQEWKQSLDVYVPETLVGAPVILHVHGGGWSRGDRTKQFYGAPGLCDAFAGMGFLAIAISYRLGSYPTFVQDAATAIAFVLRELRQEALLQSCDWDTFLLSGHSAGAHIVSLLLSDPQFLEAAGVSPTSIKGALLLSGIYTLRNPFGTEHCTWKNWAFQRVYMRPAFSEADLNPASPCWRLAQGYLPPEDLEHFVRQILPTPKKGEPLLDIAAHRSPVSPKVRLLEVPVVVFSAERDLGLEFDSDRFYEMLTACNAFYVKRVIVKKTTHPSICTSEESYPVIAEAVLDVIRRVQ